MKPATVLMCMALTALPAAAFAQAQATAEDAAGSNSWAYSKAAQDLTRFKTFIVEPTVVSNEPGTSWGKASDADKQKYADLFTNALRAEIGKSYGLATDKGAGVGVMRITLMGVKPTSALTVASSVTPIGFALNGVKSIAGKPGSFSGSAQVAFELTDSQSGDLVVAVVRRRSPNALDIGSTTSTEGTVGAIAKDVADAVRAALDKANGRNS